MLTVHPEYNTMVKEYDEKLFVEWDNKISRFIVYREMPITPHYRVMVVQNPDGSFRPFDRRVIQDLNERDIWAKKGGHKEWYSEFEKENRKKEAEAEYQETQRNYDLADAMAWALERDTRWNVGNSRRFFI